MLASVAIAVVRFAHGTSTRTTVASAGCRPQSLLLVVVLDTECPSSIPTIDNIVQLPESTRDHLRLRLILTGPNVKTAPLTAKCTAIPNVDIQNIPEKDVVALYGASKSGEAFLYDSNGRLVFSGGLTSGLGCPGRSDGICAIEAAAAGQQTITTAPVYGMNLALATSRN
jgi:hypothetical protein